VPRLKEADRKIGGEYRGGGGKQRGRGRGNEYLTVQKGLAGQTLGAGEGNGQDSYILKNLPVKTKGVINEPRASILQERWRGEGAKGVQQQTRDQRATKTTMRKM